MNFLKLVRQPEYFFQPRQVLLKLKRTVQRGHAPLEEVKMPWGATICVSPAEHIGSRIWHRGVFDIVVLEALHRLIELGETALDIGANIGQMTSLMSCRLGRGGRVLAFEPHPRVFELLSDNVGRLKPRSDAAEVALHNLALSNFEGEASLELGAGWGANQGLARLSEGNGHAAKQTVKVRVNTLDNIVGPSLRAGVGKLDVEGHELKVLQGAAGLLGGRRLRDLVFEDLGPYPGPVQRHLLDYGYTLFSLQGRLTRPVLSSEWSNPQFDGELEGADFLATLEPERAMARFEPSGWRVLEKKSAN